MSEKLKAALEKYGDEIVTFCEYYKYHFTYDNERILVDVGGDASDIYRADLRNEMKLKDLWSAAGGEYSSLKISGEEIYGYVWSPKS